MLDGRVRAQIEYELSKARVNLADMEAKQRRTANVMGNSNYRLGLSYGIKVARGLVEGWEYVLGLVDQAESDEGGA